jgi:diguanylate cyclase (GGDEF)-like protein/PAS domain S-box-containing protein
MEEKTARISVFCCASSELRLDRLERWLAGPNTKVRRISSIYELLYRCSINAPELVVLSEEKGDLPIDKVVHEILKIAPFSKIALLVPSVKLQQFHFLSETSNRVSVIVEDPQGQFVGRILGLIRLEQEKKPSVEPLNRKLLGALLNTLPEALIIVDENLNIVYVNQKTTNLIDIPPENYIGTSFISQLNDASQAQTKLMFQKYFEIGQTGHEYLELMLKHNNGEVVPCTANLTISSIKNKKFIQLTLKDETSSLSTRADRDFQEQFEKFIMQFSTNILGTKVNELPRVVVSGLKTLSALLGFNRLQIISLAPIYANYQKILCWPQLRNNDTEHELDWLNKSVFQKGRVSITDTHSLPLDAMEEFDWLRGLKMHAVAGIPVNENEKETGILLAFKKKAYQWEEDDFARLEKISNLINSLLSRLKEHKGLRKTEKELVNVNKRLSHLARRDSLTGLANRRLFDQTLSQEIRRAARQRSVLSLILTDIDYFKNYNDELGHVAGDKCLKGIGATIDAVFQRAGDLTARYGGEEFVIILPGTNKEDALAEANRLRDAIEELNIPHPSSNVSKKITMSMGISTIENSLIDMSEFIQQADKALYIAKAEGRNKIVEYDEIEAKNNEKQRPG